MGERHDWKRALVLTGSSVFLRKHRAFAKTSARDPLKQVTTTTSLNYSVFLSLFYFITSYCC